MATITLTIPNAVALRIQNAICDRYGYTGFLADGVTPQTKAEFTKAWIIKMIKNDVREHEANVAMNTAQLNTHADIENNISIT